MATHEPTDSTRMEFLEAMANVRIIFGMRTTLTTPSWTVRHWDILWTSLAATY